MQKKSYFGMAAGLVLLLIIGLSFAGCVSPQTPKNETALTTVGLSKIKVMPDTVGIYYNIEANGTTAAITGDKNAKITDSFITALVKLGFERKDIQTQSYSVNPDYIWEYSDRYGGRQRKSVV